MSISIEDELFRRLKRTAGSRGMSRFIAEAVREKLKESEGRLQHEYQEAAGDPERRETLEDWDAIETEGW